jgi:HNH endonuclease/Helix-turn-helix
MELGVKFGFFKDTMKLMELAQRFWRKVRKGKDCWLWLGVQNGTGYGQIRATKMIYAHRLSWEFCHGPIPKGKCVLHRCDVRNCVNPDHLFLGTIGDNNRDTYRKGKRCSPRGGGAGEDNANAVFSNATVLNIRRERGLSHRQLAEKYGVAKSTISGVLAGTRYKGV